ncbi:hypothetical protein [Kribbella shirazensis]|uniref:Uncharacterized protein n=1 Tax=Kribbella shirazensis TaxID=1105143 RepID=A0A7X5V7A7_9ACTN|nr:hypothetical protein [Kribbella shirazensis]NIK55193.1 hypothetical protein [Kribbella shirazensis]
MTALAVPTSAGDPRPLLGVDLPAHVLVQLNDGWSPAWLIGRLHCADGWVALVQFLDNTGTEQTVRVPADRVSVTTVRHL